nr:hypothetical protein [Calditrichia bacterium]
TYLEEIAAIDAGEIRRIAASYLVPEKMTLVVVGDWAVLQDQMRQIGDCQRLDIHFNAIG